MKGRVGVGANGDGRMKFEPLMITALDEMDIPCSDIWATLPGLYDSVSISALPLGPCTRDSAPVEGGSEAEDTFEALLMSGFPASPDGILGMVFEGLSRAAVL